jgi:hypothetical protein
MLNGLSHPLLTKMLEKRGLLNEQAQDFLSPDYDKHTHDPYLLKDMAKAVERVIRAIKNNEKIEIYSDYDADGIPGAVVLHDFFKKVGFENSVTKEGEKKISTHAHLLVEKTKTLPIKKMTTGLRPKSPDELPILGPLPSQKNLFVAAGHYRNGILLAPITAKVVTDFVNNHPFSISIDSFIPQHNSK